MRHVEKSIDISVVLVALPVSRLRLCVVQRARSGGQRPLAALEERVLAQLGAVARPEEGQQAEELG